ncbi:MAG TPA: alpha/beta hydrolase [Alphaproteobacteria bacterium]|nr:alpha/beta hydrolase [Alphaproteobacteria bacterium]
MSFDDLPPLPALIHPDGPRYVDHIMTLGRQAQSATRCVLDQPYGPDYWQKLDVYLPDGESHADLPVLCFLPGGAWVNGCKEWLAFMAPAIVGTPAAFVAVSYRHAPAARFPAQLEDTLDAVGWILRNIAKYGGNPHRIHLGGHSAGGHLAALATLRRDAARARGVPDGAIQSCLAISAPFDLASDDPVRRQKVASFLSRPEDVTVASPICFTMGNHVRFHITYGAKDLPELIPQASRMADALRAAGNVAELLELECRNHFNTHEDCGIADRPWTTRVRTLLRNT